MTPRTIDAVLFDLGGVLVEIQRDWAALCASVGFVPGASSFEPEARSERAAALEAYHLGAISIEACSDAWARTCGAPCDRATATRLIDAIVVRPYDGGLELVRELDSMGIVTGCLSNTNALHWQRMCRDFPVMGALRHRLASHELGVAKPDRAIFDRALQVLDLPASRVLLFDDLPENCAAARDAGWSAMLVDYERPTATQMRSHLRGLGVLVAS